MESSIRFDEVFSQGMTSDPITGALTYRQEVVWEEDGRTLDGRYISRTPTRRGGWLYRYEQEQRHAP